MLSLIDAAANVISGYRIHGDSLLNQTIEIFASEPLCPSVESKRVLIGAVIQMGWANGTLMRSIWPTQLSYVLRTGVLSCETFLEFKHGCRIVLHASALSCWGYISQADSPI